MGQVLTFPARAKGMSPHQVLAWLLGEAKVSAAPSYVPEWLGPCLETHLSKDPKGYGRVWVGDRLQKTHRFVYEQTRGSIEEGLICMHLCDNTSCIAPLHLTKGTHRDNAHDRDRKERGKIPDNRGSRHGMAKLTESDVREIRKLYDTTSLSSREIGERFGVSKSVIIRIGRRKKWTHVKEDEHGT